MTGGPCLSLPWPCLVYLLHRHWHGHTHIGQQFTEITTMYFVIPNSHLWYVLTCYTPSIHEKMKVATAAVRLLLEEARSQIHYMQVQTDLFCVYNFCCLYNCNAMQWFEARGGFVFHRTYCFKFMGISSIWGVLHNGNVFNCLEQIATLCMFTYLWSRASIKSIFHPQCCNELHCYVWV